MNNPYNILNDFDNWFRFAVYASDPNTYRRACENSMAMWQWMMVNPSYMPSEMQLTTHGGTIDD